MSIPKEKLIWMYKTMFKSRYYEETIEKNYMADKSPFNIGAGLIPGEMHLSTGQEPAAVGIIAHLTDEDAVTSPHRLHHHAIAKGVNLNKMTAEIYGKVTGLSKGKGGHMHLFDSSVKYSASGIVASGMPQGLGTALAAKKRGSDAVTVNFIGEGATNAGAFHESLNMAALWNLPYIVVVEDNLYGISVSKDDATPIESNDMRAPAYNIVGEKVTENDPIEMYKVSERAVERARTGNGPTIIEIETYRYMGHFQGDPEVYREEGEVEELRAKDPIDKMRKSLIEDGVYTEIELTKQEKLVKEEVDKAFKFAQESDYPVPESAFEDVFTP